MYVVSEIIAELPGMQEHQFSVWLNHTSLLSAILTHCSIPEEKHSEALALLSKMVVRASWQLGHLSVVAACNHVSVSRPVLSNSRTSLRS